MGEKWEMNASLSAALLIPCKNGPITCSHTDCVLPNGTLPWPVAPSVTPGLGPQTTQLVHFIIDSAIPAPRPEQRDCRLCCVWVMWRGV